MPVDDVRKAQEAFLEHADARFELAEPALGLGRFLAAGLHLQQASVTDDPARVGRVDLVLFGVQLGGGTDIAQALGYCQRLVDRPAETVVVVISDLFEGGDVGLLQARAAALVRSGVTLVALVTLSDEGAPAYDHAQVARFAELGIPSLACTPDAFPDLFAAALERRPLGPWASDQPGVVAVH